MLSPIGEKAPPVPVFHSATAELVNCGYSAAGRRLLVVRNDWVVPRSVSGTGPWLLALVPPFRVHVPANGPRPSIGAGVFSGGSPVITVPPSSMNRYAPR